MLLNIPKILSPELIKALCEMGHGDKILLADANYPGKSAADRCGATVALDYTDVARSTGLRVTLTFSRPVELDST